MPRTMTQVQTWQKIARNWANFTAPSRPSLGDCKVYELWTKRTLSTLRSPNILVLGVTPEIRNLLFKYSLTQDAKVYLADINKGMFRAMRAFLNFNNPNEYFKPCNWLKMPFQREFFDFIIGDLVITNLALKDKEKFLKEIKRLLKEEGRFVTRILVYKENRNRNFNLSQVLNQYFQQYQKAQLSLRDTLGYFYSAIVQETYYLNEKGEYSLKYLIADFEKLRKEIKDPLKKIFLGKFLKDYHSVLDDKVWVGMTQPAHERLVKKHFQIEKIESVRDHPFGDRYLIYVLKKK
ncbi:MAG: class I SAM-dependent methyltransferase [Candidatus Doudnabacteria bacterium]